MVKKADMKLLLEKILAISICISVIAFNVLKKGCMKMFSL
jgi:hypothetical protein